jgi:uncharacterized protein YerC
LVRRRQIADASLYDWYRTAALGREQYAPKFFLVDGHHRYEAYKSVKWNDWVPVEYFRGTLQEAQAEAIRRNSASKLRITDADKLESAWKMLKYVQAGDAEWTWKEITNLTGASKKTIHRMSLCLKAYGEKAAERPWARARRLAYEEQQTEDN